MNKVNGILSALDLAVYISDKYSNDNSDKKISNIKLQKSLYFLFAYWGGFVKQGQDSGSQVEQNCSDYDLYLFNDKIEAWTYGPVVPHVYHNIENYLEDANIEDIKTNISEQYDGFLQSFIDSWLDMIFPMNDFRLVDISHEDSCWINNYNSEDDYHNKEIDKMDIIKLYAYDRYAK